MFRKILIGLLTILIIIQFIHPKRNTAEGVQPNYIGNVYNVPADTKNILAKACNDCHSNNTKYPWYSNLQPVDWWMNKHVKDGKKHLNYDEYTSKSTYYQYHKMEETIEMVEDNKMPLNSYTWSHKDAKLTPAEKTSLINWAKSVMSSMEAKYPPDSLKRKK
jgi:hypothetical protein